MIAKITDANQEYYAPRFAYITAELDKRADLPSIVIDSLESYYANIEYIKQLYSREDGSNAGYLLLTSPADEEYFAIDANARTIAVPASFKKYGVGVDYVPWPDVALKIESGDTVFDSSKLDSLIGSYTNSRFTDWVK